MTQCAARRRGTNSQCRKHAARGRNVCWLHGGKTPRGIASPNFKTGRWSKDLPTRLAARYEAAMGDPKLLVLRDQVAVIDARVGELIAGLDRGEAGRHWVSLRGLLVEFTKAQSAGKAPEMAVILAQITTAINEGASEAARWAEVLGTMQVQQRLVESERRRMVELQQVLTAREAILLMQVATGALQEGVRRFVDDPKTRQQILSFVGGEFAQLASVGDGNVGTAN